MSITEKFTAWEVVTALRGALDSLFEMPADSSSDTWLRMPHKDARELLIQCDTDLLTAAFILNDVLKQRSVTEAQLKVITGIARRIGQARDRVEIAKVPARVESATSAATEVARGA